MRFPPRARSFPPDMSRHRAMTRRPREHLQYLRAPPSLRPLSCWNAILMLSTTTESRAPFSEKPPASNGVTRLMHPHTFRRLRARSSSVGESGCTCARSGSGRSSTSTPMGTQWLVPASSRETLALASFLSLAPPLLMFLRRGRRRARDATWIWPWCNLGGQVFSPPEGRRAAPSGRSHSPVTGECDRRLGAAGGRPGRANTRPPTGRNSLSHWAVRVTY